MSSHVTYTWCNDGGCCTKWGCDTWYSIRGGRFHPGAVHSLIPSWWFTVLYVAIAVTAAYLVLQVVYDMADRRAES